MKGLLLTAPRLLPRWQLPPVSKKKKKRGRPKNPVMPSHKVTTGGPEPTWCLGCSMHTPAQANTRQPILVPVLCALPSMYTPLISRSHWATGDLQKIPLENERHTDPWWQGKCSRPRSPTGPPGLTVRICHLVTGFGTSHKCTLEEPSGYSGEGRLASFLKGRKQMEKINEGRLRKKRLSSEKNLSFVNSGNGWFLTCWNQWVNEADDYLDLREENDHPDSNRRYKAGSKQKEKCKRGPNCVTTIRYVQ